MRMLEAMPHSRDDLGARIRLFLNESVENLNARQRKCILHLLGTIEHAQGLANIV
jgi:DNA-binding phage protein